MGDFQKIDKFEVTGKLGQGSFGVVYKGRDPFLKRDVAIKVCTAGDEALRQRFFREAEIAGRLEHRNIVSVFALGFESGVPFLVQEFLEGEDLRQALERAAPMSGVLRLEILLQVAEGLAYAHEQGVIHRDVKPANVRLVADGRVKVIDFGIAKLASDESQLTQKGVTMGTASYLPPEQVRGGDTDHRADIFPSGCWPTSFSPASGPSAARPSRRWSTRSSTSRPCRFRPAVAGMPARARRGAEQMPREAARGALLQPARGDRPPGARSATPEWPAG